MKPRMKLWTAALEPSQLPLPRLPEVALCGRSNSGKSTLVNFLCGRYSAKVKREPGSTTELVFWQIGRPAQLCLVDLPGYGFATSREMTRLQWTEFTLWYLRFRKNLARVLLLADARWGLKPADKEDRRISYLERHNVKWQLVLTKCDKVKSKELAKRITMLEDEMKDYQRMAGSPIPISALKQKGMDRLREELGKLKVQKQIVKDGIRKRVYDLLEMRRIRRAERARVRREQRRQEEEEAEAKAAAEAIENEEVEPTHVGAHGAETPDGAETAPAGSPLHDALSDWGLGEASERAGDTESRGGAASQAVADYRVEEKHYTLDDRDSLRVSELMSSLFPDLSDLRPEAVREEGGPSASLGAAPADRLSARPPPAGLGLALADAGVPGDPMGCSDEESDGPVVLPTVIRFDPAPRHAGAGGPAQRAPAHASGAAPLFPGLAPRPVRAAAPPLQARLTPESEWLRPGRHKDQLYDPDDFASPDDVASGFRGGAPPTPDAARPGALIQEARRRYEREWAMELVDIEKSRAGAVDVGGGDGVAAGAGAARAAARRGRRERQVLPYISQGGGELAPTERKSMARWRILGRPPSVVLKKRRERDVSSQMGVKDLRGRKRNDGGGLSWEDARKKWLNWYERNKRKKWDKVSQAESPRREDVEARFVEERQRRLRLPGFRRGGRPKDAAPGGGGLEEGAA
ncbi:unnamed protein product [Prorocentrum cordatum]|uniref:EngB-type G domain-containing protein n=1 Tax=Prorocentrum cordatum TaxID=2364126 RepID=A0ABN9XBV0_9DINO|nr:unnamed protein product [Polarella glacialis]